jgi:hypothetical protein
MFLDPSVAVIFRLAEQEQPTFLLDEVDNIFTKHGKDDENAELRGLLNNGYRKGATVPRCVGQSHEIRRFPVYAPVAFAGLGDLPAVLMSRCIVIRMRPALPGEIDDDLDPDEHGDEAAQLRDRLSTWLAAADLNRHPPLPKGLRSRARECWRPLISIADAAGGDWPERARDACTDLSQPVVSREASLGVRLLSDLREVWIAAGDPENMHTTTILSALHDMPEAPWADLRGQGLNARGLANRLGAYEIPTGKSVRVGNEARKGYSRADLWEAWTRYVFPRVKVTRVTDPTDENRVTYVTPTREETYAAGDGSLFGEPSPNGHVTATLCAADGCPHEPRNDLLTCAAHAMLELKLRTEKGIPL